MAILRSIAWLLIKRLIRLRFPSVKPLSTADLAAWLQQDETPQLLLLDARTPAEYQISHLPQARLAPADVSELIATLPPDTPIVTYCSIGYRSAKLAAQLQQHGYPHVFNLEGSIFAWVNESRSVYRGEQVVDQIHPYNDLWQRLLTDSIQPKR